MDNEYLPKPDLVEFASREERDASFARAVAFKRGRWAEFYKELEKEGSMCLHEMPPGFYDAAWAHYKGKLNWRMKKYREHWLWLDGFEPEWIKLEKPKVYHVKD